ncbi:MAG: arginyltransferase [Gammaproteobacteria bacterium]
MRNDQNHTDLQRLAFYQSQEHPCSYLPGRRAASLFADPTARMTNDLYGRLAEFGFRRSGAHIYRPSCPTCNACTPVRIPVNEFQHNRTQRRIRRYNEGMRVTCVPAQYNATHFDLYRRYVEARHPGGGMDDPDPRKYLEFLTCGWSDTRFYEFRDQEQLLAVAVIDHIGAALSAVYTFYDPDQSARSLGTYAVLWEIELARALGLSWLYLGYWIEECRKMAYKGRLRPLHVWREGRWSPLNSPPD